MNLPRSFLKKVSATTALPIPAAGEMKNAVIARQTPIVAYVGLLAHPILPMRLQINEMRKMGLRPKRFDSGLQNSGAPPRIAI